jgi:pSer/pThr/pTyr-binding forkhead associated (FHA) protein
MASIEIASGERRGDRYPLGHRTNVVGRAESLPIQILDDRVSRKHAQIRFDPATGRYSMLDMCSRNGVFLNGARVTAEAILNHCDRIRIGRTELVFSERDPDGNTALLHRFNKPGERQRPTQPAWSFDSPVLRRQARPAPVAQALRALPVGGNRPPKPKSLLQRL